MTKQNPDHFRKLFVFAVMTLLLVLLLMACRNENANQVPKPRAYPRVDFPEKTYTTFDRKGCQFSFEIPEYAEIRDYSGQIEGVVKKDCWFDIALPSFNGKIHCSYYPVNKDNSLDSLIYDSFALVGKHTIKAQYIKETRIELPDQVYGVLFNLSGPAASPSQFFLTDSLNHFFRGSLYFENKTQVDSMEIVYNFVNEDIEHLLNSFRWK